MDLNGKLAVVTGASSGIGREFARQLHAKGCTVFSIARREKLLLQLTDELNSLRPESAKTYVCDLTDEGDLLALCAQLKTIKVDILVNNAGIGSFGFFEEVDIDREVKMVKLNIIAPMRILHAVLPQMKAQNLGAILSISSLAALQSVPYMSTYSGTKSFNLHSTLALRHELLNFGIRSIVVCPGPVATEFGGVARVPGQLTNIPRQEPELIVRRSLEALEANKAWVIPSWTAWFLSLPSRILPFDLATSITEKTLIKSLEFKRHQSVEG